ncbi:MAG TPA: hypothetical protein VJW76_14065 [Verrucomicrobiae bacterium]|nr:hypothetical protein [Verrucomicrobiae bacterium]
MKSSGKKVRQSTQRWLVHVANSALLVIVLIGIPAITSLRLGSIRLLSDPKLQMLTLGGLGLIGVANFAGALLVKKDKKTRHACRAWALLFGIILAAEFLYVHGFIHFRWLKKLLLWVQETL